MDKVKNTSIHLKKETRSIVNRYLRKFTAAENKIPMREFQNGSYDGKSQNLTVIFTFSKTNV